MTSRIAVIDHGAGNLVSIARALESTGATVTVATEPEALAGMDGVVLPGVGATGAAMERLAAARFVEPLHDLAVPLLGICVGLQLFFDTSEEDGGPCLGLVPGVVARLEGTPRLPHIGWNDVDLAADPLFAGIPGHSTFYFVHSYAPVPADPSTVIGTSAYGEPFVAAVRSGTRVGVQFHPERSGRAGLRLIENFVAIAREASRAA